MNATTTKQTSNDSESAIWAALINGVADAVAMKNGDPVDAAARAPADGAARAIYIDAFRKTLAG